MTKPPQNRTLDPKDEEIWGLSKLNDVLDIGLFLVGFLIPMGDPFESAMGGVFDLLLGYWYLKDKRIGKQVIPILLLECIDVADLFTPGFFDVIGWIELVPFWFLFYRRFLNDLKLFEETRETILEEKSPVLRKNQLNNVSMEKNEFLLCRECGAVVKKNMTLCEACGKDIIHVKQSRDQELADKLSILKKMLNSGFLTLDEYETKKNELLKHR